MRSTDFCVDVCLPDRRWARASVPLWCILLLAGVVGFTRLSSLWGCSSHWCCAVIFGVMFSTVSNILLLFDVCLSLIWLPATVSLYTR